MKPIAKDNSLLGYSSLQLYPNIFHFVTTRQGGFGSGRYATFNCSPFCGDDPQIVALNQGKLKREIPVTQFEFIIPRQTHGCEIVVIDSEFLLLPSDKRLELLEGVDALITAEPNCCLAVSTADCVPILLFDPVHKVVAAIHAGWRGTVQDIVGKTVSKMKECYGTCPTNLVAAIGPSISQDAFEVGNEVYAAFQQAGFDMSAIALLQKDTNKWHINLWEANRQQLLSRGVSASQIELAGLCTWTQHDRFFSARRLGIDSGRMLSGILLK